MKDPIKEAKEIIRIMYNASIRMKPLTKKQRERIERFFEDNSK